MKVIRYGADTRGVSEAGWLHSRFSFSFAHYWNPARMGFGALRVLNDDIIDGGGGFGMHPHRDMEIITVVTEGTLEHKDSEGNHGILTPGEVQVMSAGSGITHSEYNHSDVEPLALFQLWIETKEKGIKPQYGQTRFEFPENTLVPVASGMGDEGALPIHQDARVLVGTFGENGTATHSAKGEHGVFAFVIDGSFTIADTPLEVRDALEITDANSFAISSQTGGKLMLIEVPMGE